MFYGSYLFDIAPAVLSDFAFASSRMEAMYFFFPEPECGDGDAGQLSGFGDGVVYFPRDRFRRLEALRGVRFSVDEAYGGGERETFIQEDFEASEEDEVFGFEPSVFAIGTEGFQGMDFCFQVSYGGLGQAGDSGGVAYGAACG